MRRAEHKNRVGFTLVELITTLAVISILLAFLIPALTAVQKTAVNVKQRAQFHAISLGVESFHQDNGYYPPSSYKIPSSGVPYDTASACLAEAMIGKDGFGFHPDSVFRTGGYDSSNNPLYLSSSGFPTTDEARAASLQARTGPYLELEGANAVQIQHIYGALSDAVQPNSLVLVDMYSKVKHLGTGKQTGMPILYYRADSSKVGHAAADMDNSTYNVGDALYIYGSTSDHGIAGLPVPFLGAGSSHPMADNPQLFYAMTENPNFSNPKRPYRAESFILQSAGPDGLYGTIDDVFNFDSGK